MNSTMDLSFLIHESEDVYHAKAGQFLTSHYLADFRKSPQLFFKRKLGLNSSIELTHAAIRWVDIASGSPPSYSAPCPTSVSASP